MKPIAYLTLNKIDYPIFKVKDGYVAVDENPLKLNNGDPCFYRIKETIDFYDDGDLYCSKIIASTFPLEGVKRFEMVDEIEDLIKSIHLDRANLQHIAEYLRVNGTLYLELKRILKAAQSKGSFTEEQARLIFNEGFAIGNSQIEESEGSEHFYDSDFERIIQSLLPRHEVEMEEGEEIHTGRAGSTSYPIFEQVPLTYEKDGVTYLKFKNH